MGAVGLVVSATAGGVVPGVSAFEATVPVAAVTPAAVSAGPADQAAADREFVRWIGLYDDRDLVRSSAWRAFGKRSDAAVADWLATGYTYVAKLAATTSQRNTDFAKRVLATSPVDVWPNLHAAARYALDGTATDRDRFARTEYAAAKERDRQALAADADRAARLVQADRDFVAAVGAADPGDGVRVAAALALRSGADADVVEFLVHDWVAAARADLLLHRQGRVDADTARRAAVRRLVTDARVAEQAALDSSDETEEQARAVAARAWAAVTGSAAPGVSAWAGAAAVARSQAATWQQVLAAALAAGGGNWTAVAGAAPAVQGDWAAEQAFAADQAAYWTGLLDDARAAELRWSAPPAR